MNPKSAKQQIHRRKYGEAVEAWRALSTDDQHLWNLEAKNLIISGYNLFIMAKLTPPELYSVAGTTDIYHEYNAWADMSQMTLTFESNASRLLCVGSAVVNPYIAEAIRMGMRILVDGAPKVYTTGYMNLVQFVNLVLQELVTVEPGEHVVKMQWRSWSDSEIDNNCSSQSQYVHRSLSVFAFP